MKHIWAVPAYGTSPYLEACIRSLLGQKVKSSIILCTSTPNEHIRSLAEKYNIPLFIRLGQPSIGADWNYAYRCALDMGADLITLAHQDDVYRKDYLKECLESKAMFPDMSLFASSCAVSRLGRVEQLNGVLLVKKLLRLPLRRKDVCDLKEVKRAAITFGNPIICPSCSYSTDYCKDLVFDASLSFVLDWDALYTLSEKPGRWVVSEKPLMIYRIHDGAATADAIKNNKRKKEEAEMFRKLLPSWLSPMIRVIYRLSYGAYKE